MSKQICIEFVAGAYGSTALCVNDYRITPNKIWGYGHVESKFYIDYDFLKKSCNKNGEIDFEVGRKSSDTQELFVNGQPTQGKISLNEFQEHLKRIEKRRKRFERTPGNHHWELCRRYRCPVKMTDIDYALSYK